MAGIADLRMAFTVGFAFDGPDDVSVYSVSREGFQAYVRDDDQETIDQLMNPPLVVETPSAVVAAPVALPATATLADVIAAVNALSGATG